MLVRALKLGDRVSGEVRECLECGQWFIGRADAKFCGGSCRVRSHRLGVKRSG